LNVDFSVASSTAIGDHAALKTLQEHEIIQLERHGYYRADRPYLSADATGLWSCT
jgi:glutamyl-tRNA synthetase